LQRLLPTRDDLIAMGRHPHQDLVAGLTVAIVALPLALAFGAASGLGAQSGLATAVIAGILAALFGGSNIQVSGPTGAMTVVLIPVVHEHGPTGVLMVGFLAGLLLLGMALAGLGRFVRYLPVSVIEGFTAGIAVVIFLQQVPAALGVTDASGEKVWATAADAVGRFASQPQVAPLVVSLGVMSLMLAGARWHPRVPYSLIGIAVATAAVHFGDVGLVTLGHLPSTLQAPSLGFVDPGAISVLATAALAIAALAALESLLCATVADAMTVNERLTPTGSSSARAWPTSSCPCSAGSQPRQPSPVRQSTCAPVPAPGWPQSVTPSSCSCWSSSQRQWCLRFRSQPWPACSSRPACAWSRRAR